MMEDGGRLLPVIPIPKWKLTAAKASLFVAHRHGANIKICSGHDDMVTAYDMDGDGKTEVLMAVSEGTTFADGTVIKGSNGQVTDCTDYSRAPLPSG